MSGNVCWSRKLKVNVSESKVMIVSKDGEYSTVLVKCISICEWRENGTCRLFQVSGYKKHLKVEE